LGCAECYLAWASMATAMLSLGPSLGLARSCCDTAGVWGSRPEVSKTRPGLQARRLEKSGLACEVLAAGRLEKSGPAEEERSREVRGDEDETRRAGKASGEVRPCLRSFGRRASGEVRPGGGGESREVRSDRDKTRRAGKASGEVWPCLRSFGRRASGEVRPEAAKQDQKCKQGVWRSPALLAELCSRASGEVRPCEQSKYSK